MTSTTIIAAITVVISAIGIAIALVFSYGVTARYYNEAIGRTEDGGDERGRMKQKGGYKLKVNGKLRALFLRILLLFVLILFSGSQPLENES